MATTLDMSLDDIIKKSKTERFRGRGGARRGRGQGQGPIDRSQSHNGKSAGTYRGPLRVNAQKSPFTISKPFRKNKSFPLRHDLFDDGLTAVGFSGLETGTKLYISNLDHRVTNEDLRELFAEIGDIKRYAVHYDKNGLSSGSAEVIYTRRSDAFAALKKYNNVQLDGKPMKIEIIGANLEVPILARVNAVGGPNGSRKRTVVMTPRVSRRGGIAAVSRGSGQRIQRGFSNAGRGRGGAGRGGGSGGGRGRGRGKKQPVKISEVELDKELENYHTEAMNTS